MSIGEALASARREAGLTLTQVSDATRVRETIVAGIEHDDFSRCGGDFYARGHIRSIGAAVGIDPEPLVKQYDREHGGAPGADGPGGAPDPAPLPDTRVFGRLPHPNWSVALGVLLVLAVVFGVFQLVSGSSEPTGRSGPLAGASRSDAGGTDGRTPPDSEATAPRGSSAPTGPQARSGGPSPSLQQAVIRLRVRSETWVSATNANGEQLFTGMMYQGDSRSFADDEMVQLRLGNAGGVFVTVNGRNLGTVGEPGDVINFRVYPDRVEGLS